MILERLEGSRRDLRAEGHTPGWLEAGGLLGPGVRLVFTNREGGVSHPPFQALNLAYHTGDDPRAVAANRAILAKSLGLEERRIVFPEQAHGMRVSWVSARSGGGATPGEESLRDTDGLLCGEEGLALAVLTADCVPIALCYPERNLVALLHAGWRGTMGDIVGNACRLVEKDTGLRPHEARVVMGPSIGPCCYEVDEGRARSFVERYGEDTGVARRREGWSVDLRRANLLNMLRCGIREENVFEVGGCTCCDPGYFSYRREGVTGRQGAFLWIDEHWRRTAEERGHA